MQSLCPVCACVSSSVSFQCSFGQWTDKVKAEKRKERSPKERKMTIEMRMENEVEGEGRERCSASEC